MLCPRRNENAGGRIPGPDHWNIEPNGDRTCSYCGSLHEEDYIRICEEYLKGSPGYSVDSTCDKSYKVYAHGPGVSNASEGGIKFYKMHIDHTHPDYARRGEIHAQASKKCWEEFNERWKDSK